MIDIVNDHFLCYLTNSNDHVLFLVYKRYALQLQNNVGGWVVTWEFE